MTDTTRIKRNSRFSKIMERTMSYTRLSSADSKVKEASYRDFKYDIKGDVKILNRIVCTDRVLCLDYTESNDCCAVGYSKGIIELYSTDSSRNSRVLTDSEITSNPTSVTAINHRPVKKFYPRSNTITATYSSGCVKCWYVPSAQCVYTIHENRETLGLAYHANFPKFVTTGADCRVNLYDEETRTLERVFRSSDVPGVVDGHESKVFSAVFRPRTVHEIVSGGWDNRIMFWDSRQPSAVRYLSGAYISGDGIDIHASGNEVLTCSCRKKNAIQLWDYGSGRLIVTIQPDGYLSSMHSGKYASNAFIACGGTDKNIFRIVDLRSHSTVGSVYNLNSAIYDVKIGQFTGEKNSKTKIGFCSGNAVYEVTSRII